MSTIGLAGYGVVGREVAFQIDHLFPHQHRIKTVAVRNPAKYVGEKYPFTSNLFDLAWDPEIDVVIEVIGGIQPALDFIRECLNRKKSVITANKYLIAYHGVELRALAQSNGVQLLYEASVGGAIPILSALNSNLRHHRIQSLTGIINGSTNYILSRLEDQPNFPIPGILDEARQKGFLEADPSFDLKGWDIGQKLTILAWHAFGIVAEPGELPVFSLMDISDEEQAITRYGALKYLARLERHDDSVSAWVIPTLIRPSHPLSAIRNEYNGILMTTAFSGNQLLAGKGAGGNPTACSVIADLQSVGQPVSPVRADTTLRIRNNHHFAQLYIRTTRKDFREVTRVLAGSGHYARIIGPDQLVVKNLGIRQLIEIRDLIQFTADIPDTVFVEARHPKFRSIAV